MKRSTALLIVGYNRPELVLSSIKRIMGASEFKIIVSIDGPRNADSDLSNRWLTMTKELNEVNWILRSENLGLAKHVFTAISEVMQDFHNCIVLEDDVKVDLINLIEMNRILEKRLPAGILTVGLFGGLPSLPILNSFMRNRWRLTRYFSAWGWGIQREDWSDFSLDIAKIEKRNIDKITRKSVGKTRLNLWSRRFRIVADNPYFTWDYQLFLYSLILDKKHLLPTFRTCENLGFNDERATNTKDRKPSWYRGRMATRVFGKSIRRQNSFLSKLLQGIDSLTWAGDQPLLQKTREIKRRYLNS